MKQDFTVSGHLDGVEAFLRVADRRNFRVAAGDLGVSPSALSQKIRALEERIGVALFTRTTRSVGLTQAGQIFLDRARPAFAELVGAYEATRTLGEPSGLLRLHMPRAVIALLIEPIIADFRAAYPRIAMEIVASERPVDLVREGFDAGVQLGELLDKDMIAFRLTQPIPFVVAGSPDYFARRGRPRSPADVRDHDCLRLRILGGEQTGGHWVFLDQGKYQEVTVDGPLIANDYGLITTAALRGLGLCFMSAGLVQPHLASGDLETVLDEYMPRSDGLFLYYPNRAQALPKLRVFLDFVRTHLAR